MPLQYFIIAFVIISFIEIAFFVIVFSFENKLAKRITRYLMKTQHIKYVRTMKDIDDRLDEIVKKDEKKHKGDSKDV